MTVMYVPAKTHEKAVFFVIAALLLSCTFSSPVIAAEEDIWSDEPAKTPRRFQLTDERIEQILNRIAEKAPQRAEELKRLRKEDPEKFNEQIRAELAKIQPPPKPGPEGPRGERDFSRRRPTESPTPGDRPRTRGQGRTGRWRENMQRRHEEYIQWLEKRYPDEAERLDELQQNDPEQYFKSVFSSMRKYGRIMDAEKRNPELADILKEDLEIQDLRVELLEQIKQSNDKKREELVKQLEDLVSRRFDLIVRKKQLQYEDLQKRLQEMQAELKQRQLEVRKLQETKDKALKERLEELIGQTEKVNWK
jgi:hypothetical protein